MSLSMLKLARNASSLTGVIRAASNQSADALRASERLAEKIDEAAVAIVDLHRQAKGAWIALSQMLSDGGIDLDEYPGATQIRDRLGSAIAAYEKDTSQAPAPGGAIEDRAQVKEG